MRRENKTAPPKGPYDLRHHTAGGAGVASHTIGLEPLKPGISSTASRAPSAESGDPRPGSFVPVLEAFSLHRGRLAPRFRTASTRSNGASRSTSPESLPAPAVSVRVD